MKKKIVMLIFFKLLIIIFLIVGCAGINKKNGLQFKDPTGNVINSNLKAFLSDDKIALYDNGDIKFVFEGMRSLYNFFQMGDENTYDIKIIPSFKDYSKKQVGEVDTRIETLLGPLKKFVSTVSYKVNVSYDIIVMTNQKKIIASFSHTANITANGEGSSPRHANDSCKRKQQRKASIENARSKANFIANSKVFIKIVNHIVNNRNIRAFELYLAENNNNQNPNLKNTIIWNGAFPINRLKYADNPILAINERVINKTEVSPFLRRLFVEPRVLL